MTPNITQELVKSSDPFVAEAGPPLDTIPPLRRSAYAGEFFHQSILQPSSSTNSSGGLNDLADM
jgi:hypothetical protein